MIYSELATLSDEQLVHAELGLERDLVNARFRHYTNQLEDTASLRKVRRDIAKCQTEARKREIVAGLNKNSLRDQHRPTFDASATADAAAADEGGGFLAGIVDKLKTDD